jgi:multidrug efflux pump subunit AcrB
VISGGHPEISQLLAGRPDSNFGGLTMVPWDQRERSQQEVQRSCRQNSRVAGMEMFTFGTPPARVGRRAAGELCGRLHGGLRRVEPWAASCVQAARESGCLSSSTRAWTSIDRKLSVDIDRELAARLGISMRDIANTLAVMLGEAEVNRFTRDGRSYKVIPQAGRISASPQGRTGEVLPAHRGGDLVPLSSVISLSTPRGAQRAVAVPAAQQHHAVRAW